MQVAYQEACKAFEEGEVPVGAVVVAQGRIIAKAYNQTEKLQDPTAHAEMLAITAATNFLQAKYLTQCRLYVSLEPCLMCAGAIAWAQVESLIWAASDEKKGFSRLGAQVLHPKTKIVKGIMAEETEALLKKFFKKLRN
ncbi:MAG: nucleoside deaminase [Saprospiraceae bacterium]|nr:nucleoside deaminase [Saprospiraceae bacterium]